jgi:threonine/homoserine/homoserine lactone efflux protein
MKPDTPPWVQAIAIAIVLANTVLWYGSIAILFSRSLVQRLYTTSRRTINRLSGAVMIAFGARLLLARD